MANHFSTIELSDKQKLDLYVYERKGKPLVSMLVNNKPLVNLTTLNEIDISNIINSLNLIKLGIVTPRNDETSKLNPPK